MRTNRQVLLAARPVGLPRLSDFRLVETPVRAPAEGELLVELHYLSLDPYMRGRMSDAPSYAPSVAIGEVMVGGAVGRVIASRHPRFPEGEIVEGRLGWQELALSDGRGIRRVDPALGPLSTAVGVLGMPGMTAYFGMLDVARPQPGETVVVSSAAGAVGSLAGQIAKLKGCRVIGTAGGAEKVRYVTETLGFDGAYDYRAAQDHAAGLARLCPRGIDVYFDNTGGPVTDAVFTLINPRARVAVCGQIAHSSATGPETGPRILQTLVRKQARVEGFLVVQFLDRHAESLAAMARWLREGKLVFREDVTVGLENAPAAFIGMLGGKNFGKALVKLPAA
ncbi:MAG: NADP-dependent oxidoreductase [Candidatus Lambdaproteobacteria bacterium]|nr:NADP-dependent oxidoreductase [Candidatus Lambdaproteobacteria bacterium]